VRRRRTQRRLELAARGGLPRRRGCTLGWGQRGRSGSPRRTRAGRGARGFRRFLHHGPSGGRDGGPRQRHVDRAYVLLGGLVEEARRLQVHGVGLRPQDRLDGVWHRRLRLRHVGRRGRLLGGGCLLEGGGSLDALGLADARLARRQQGERIDVSVGLARNAHAQVDVGVGDERVVARADPGDDRSLLDDLPTRDEDLAELQERDRVAVGRQDRDRPAPAGHHPCEGDSSRGGRPHVGAELTADVDAAVLAAGVGVVAQDEGAEDGAVGRPRPALRAGHEHECGHGREKHSPHRSPPEVELSDGDRELSGGH
jgi:hypothetical protein